MSTPSAPEFFAQLKRVCEQRKEVLVALWDHRPDYTSEIFYTENSVTAELARAFHLDRYCGYYSLDAIFFADADRVHCSPKGQTWVQNIQIAFEHEHSFRSGLFQEVSHLCITRAGLRVLVTYPERNSVDEEFKVLAQIVENANLPDSDRSFLIITGVREESNTQIGWSAHIFEFGRFVTLR